MVLAIQEWLFVHAISSDDRVTLSREVLSLNEKGPMSEPQTFSPLSDPVGPTGLESSPPASQVPAVIPPPTLGSRLASSLLMLVIAGLVVVGMAFSGVLPMGWLLGETHARTTPQSERLKGDLV